MFRIIRKYWKYLAGKLDSLHAEHADPKVLLQQAISEATDQHRRLTEQAASVVAHHRRVHQRRERLVAEHTRAQASLVHALRLIDQHRSSGDDAEADRLTATSEAVAARLLATEQEVARSEQDLIDAARAADSAKDAVARNAEQLRQKVNDRDRLLSDLDRAKMQEQVNATLRRVSTILGDDVPTLDEVRRIIEVRAARAEGMAELVALDAHGSYHGDLLALDRSLQQADARQRIEALRGQLGLPSASLHSHHRQLRRGSDTRGPANG